MNLTLYQAEAYASYLWSDVRLKPVFSTFSHSGSADGNKESPGERRASQSDRRALAKQLSVFFVGSSRKIAFLAAQLNWFYCALFFIIQSNPLSALSFFFSTHFGAQRLARKFPFRRVVKRRRARRARQATRIRNRILYRDDVFVPSFMSAIFQTSIANLLFQTAAVRWMKNGCSRLSLLAGHRLHTWTYKASARLL